MVQCAGDLVGNDHGGALSGEINIGLGLIHNPLGIGGLPNVYKPVEGLLLWNASRSNGSLMLQRRRLVVGVVSIPVSMGIAILRYRLYEIDLIINRTLVYGALTAILVVLYFGGIVISQRVLVSLTGQESTLAVMASTLLIAALFNPLRRRIQSFIDRRFYRRKYDSRKTLEAFSTKLRDETDLDALNSELVGVVQETMQPAHVSLWLRPETGMKGKQAD